MATLWIMIGAIAAAVIARGVKISEFRQAWINELRSDITEYVTKAHEWIEVYEEFNSKDSQDDKAKLAPTLDRHKYDALHLLNRIKLRFKPGDVDGDRLLAKLGNLLDPNKLVPPDRYASWREQSDTVVFDTRILLKAEWEATKNPLRKMPEAFMNKQRIVHWFVNWTDGWNLEFHQAIESKVQAEFHALFPNGLRNDEDTEPMIEKMRSFYYARMTNTAMLLMAVAATLVSVCALVVSIVALNHP